MVAITAVQQPAFAVEVPPAAVDVSKAAREVLKRHGKSAGTQMFEAIRLQVGKGRLSMGEYYAMRLFDDEQLAGADKSEFIGVDGLRKLYKKLLGKAVWHPIIGNKIIFPVLLAGFGVRTPGTKAVFGGTGPARRLRHLGGVEDLRAFLADPDNYPMFGKPIGSARSVGAESFAGVDGANILTSDGRPLGIDVVVGTIAENFSEHGYLFQERLSPHPDIRAMCGDRLATVRVVTVTTDGPEILGTAWKIPVGMNTADNFWRPGNLLATVDRQSGQVLRAIQGNGLDQLEIDAHPDTGAPIVGMTVPQWKDVMNTALACAEMFPVPVTGWDIAITESGACIVEGNPGSDLRLIQYAERRGAYDARLQSVMPYLRQRARSWHKENRQEDSARLKEVFKLAGEHKMRI